MTEDLITKAHYIVLFFTTVIVVVAVMLHYEVSLALTRWVAKTNLNHRRRILILVFGLLLLHIAEIWLFGVSSWFLVQVMGAGEIREVLGQNNFDLFDYIYFSAVTYTTVGYGDMWATGPVRFLYGSQSLVGLVLITWSASLTFIEMQRHWRLHNNDAG
ncbi:MAG: potassium channel family protein [Chromatiales bacterium]|nr:two pore domain potassium channel family protein [Gammaproteobacteria bacterium]MBW6476162.1 potassium channel family protein [Chromatiales bacterium]